MNDFFEFEGITEDLLLDKNDVNILDEKEQKSSFSAVIIAKAVGDTTQGIGNIALASAKKKEAEAKIKEIGGKRQAQLKDCETNKSFKKFADPKYRKNRIRACQEQVNKRIDLEENEQKEIVRRMASIEEGKILSEQRKSDIDLTTKTSEIDEKKSSKKLYVYGGIFALVLVLGTVIYLKSRKK
jgi:hypothetical protein